MYSTRLSRDEPVAGSLFALALDSIAEGSLITDAQRRTVYANAAFSSITGYSPDDIIGRSCSFLQGPGTSADDVERMRQALNAGAPFHGRLLNYRKDRSTFWNDLSITPMHDPSGAVTHFVSVQRDATYEVGMESTLRYSQEFDGLTGLPNRDSTRAFISAALGRARQDGSAVALAVGDVSGFRDLNHLYGYAAGDVMLEELAFRVRGVVRSQDVFGRIAADEFALVLTGLPNVYADAVGAANRALDRIADVLRRPIEITVGHEWIPTIDFGVAISPFDAREAESLLVAAETKRFASSASRLYHAAAIDEMYRATVHQ